jgi:hypothetical protein
MWSTINKPNEMLSITSNSNRNVLTIKGSAKELKFKCKHSQSVSKFKAHNRSTNLALVMGPLIGKETVLIVV